jgi:hypothetical protein
VIDAEADATQLARKALRLIRAWLEKNGPAGGNAPPRLAMKFCGGCNPTIERSAVARAIREDLPLTIQWVSADEETDLLIILNGCLSACADRPEVCKKGSEVLNISPGMISEIRRGRMGLD